ncbi:MAG: family 43 glycosylhydrolase, partial [Prevotellaceae bacterium]|nr:family 43 glycosylhydrolase [Prevotellaceae bacterium]
MKHFLSALLLLAVSMSAIAQEHRFHPRFDATNPDVHDPVMAYCDGRYYIFATGFGISCMSSADLNEWRMERPVFTDAPQWARDAVKGYRGHTWAPDIQYHNGLWYLFYSCSAFGKNTSAIGVMVNKTLNPESPLYQWIDRGKVVQSYPGKTNWNAIDPNMIVDERGREWIVWGSFWDGIQLARLKKGVVKSNPKTIARRYHLTSKQQPTEADIALANEAPDAGVNAIEAPFIIHEGDYYYLFASWDYCCKGPCSNYKTVVGRS